MSWVLEICLSKGIILPIEGVVMVRPCRDWICKTRENFKFKFFKKKEGGKTVIYRNSLEKSCDFSISRMTKRISPLESSLEI